MANVQEFLTTQKPFINIIVYAVVGLFTLIVVLYYFLVILRIKRWQVRIFEPKSDGRLYLAGFDTLEEKKTRMGKRTFYMLKKARVEATPPPYETVDHVGNKDYADYIKIRTDYTPMEKVVNPALSPHSGETKEKHLIADSIIRARQAIKTNYKTSFRDSSSVEHRFIYAPINKIPHVNVGYHQLAYDVDMSRVNAIDNLDEMFTDSKKFWEQYGPLIVMGSLIILIIIIAYMSFEYMQTVLKQQWQQTSALVDSIGKLGQNMGITPAKPPS